MGGDTEGLGAGAEGDENPVTQQPQDNKGILRHLEGTRATQCASDSEPKLRSH